MTPLTIVLLIICTTLIIFLYKCIQENNLADVIIYKLYNNPNPKTSDFKESELVYISYITKELEKRENILTS